MEPIIRQQCHEADGKKISSIQRFLLIEEPLLIRLADKPLITLMRTPGNDVDLALGYLLTEGLISSKDDVGAISSCSSVSEMQNVVVVIPASGARIDIGETYQRHVFSSCSICGKDQIEKIAVSLKPFDRENDLLTCEGIKGIREIMHERQQYFAETGASHAAALALLPLDKDCLDNAIVCEDVGRHNALDKAVGIAIRTGVDLRRSVLFLSSRLSFEMVAKAARAGIAYVAGASAPTALAVDLARSLNMFLAGFARERKFTIYSGLDVIGS